LGQQLTQSEIIKMKKILIAFVSLIVLVIALSPSLLGFSVFHLGHAVEVSTSLSAKLACSSKFMTQLDDKQIVKDLSSYSPVANLVELNYDMSGKQVTANLYGMAQVTAQYRQGVGCSLISQLNSVMNNVQLSDLTVNDDEWPKGNGVSTLAPLIQQQAEQILRSDNEKGYNTRALLVVKDGEILAEAYGPKIDSTTPLLGWSMAKSVTAMMLGILESQGQVKRGQTQLFPEWQQDNRADLNLEHLLQMSSGLEFDETYAPGSDATHMLFTADSASDVAISSPLAKEPGSYFSYSSGTTNLLSRLISLQFNNEPQQVQNFVQSQLFAPLGMTDSVFEMDASGVMVGSSYLYSSGRDWARLGWLMVNEGEINGQRLLSKQWIADAQKPNSSDNDKRYGYQFWLNSGDKELRWPELPSDAYAMMGNRQQSVMMIPSENIVFVRLGWTAGDYPMAQNYKKLLQVINAS